MVCRDNADAEYSNHSEHHHQRDDNISMEAHRLAVLSGTTTESIRKDATDSSDLAMRFRVDFCAAEEMVLSKAVFRVEDERGERIRL